MDRLTTTDGMDVDADSKRLMFAYWGRRGAMTQFMLDAAAVSIPHTQPDFSISRQNEAFAAFKRLGDRLLPISTFRHGRGALLNAWHIFGIRRRLAAHIRRSGIEAVVDMMPHVWMPLTASAIRQAGARFVVVVHDAVPHLGDPHGRVLSWQLRSLRQADRVVTLSRAVGEQLAAAYPEVAPRIVSLFHPDLLEDGRNRVARTAPAEGEPFRLLFFGRVLAYKGIDLLLDAVEMLRARAVPVSLGFFGEGNIDPYRTRLEALGAEIVNRWIAEEEVPAILARFHAVVLSHSAASQSGVAALAAGSGLPVVATSVGGLKEQVQEGHLGILAEGVDAGAIAAAIERLVRDRHLYTEILHDIAAHRQSRSMLRFLQELTAVATGR